MRAVALAEVVVVVSEPVEVSNGDPDLSHASFNSFGYHSERRLGPSHGLHSCRLCWQPVTLDARYVEEAGQHLYFRCPHCGGSFPIRRSDTGSLPAREATLLPPAAA